MSEVNWISHRIVDRDSNPKLNLTSDKVSAVYWHSALTEFLTKDLNVDVFLNEDNGDYRVKYYPYEIPIGGPFISILYPRTTDTDFEINTTVNTAVPINTTNTCIVSGSLVDLTNRPIIKPVEIIIKNIHNPLLSITGIMAVREQKFYSSIYGQVSLNLIRGMDVQISIGQFGINRTISIPNSPTARLYSLLQESNNDYQPI